MAHKFSSIRDLRRRVRKVLISINIVAIALKQDFFLLTGQPIFGFCKIKKKEEIPVSSEHENLTLSKWVKWKERTYYCKRQRGVRRSEWWMWRRRWEEETMVANRTLSWCWEAEATVLEATKPPFLMLEEITNSGVWGKGLNEEKEKTEISFREEHDNVVSVYNLDELKKKKAKIIINLNIYWNILTTKISIKESLKCVFQLLINKTLIT